MMRALLIGYGKMGHLFATLAPQYNIALSCVVDKSFNFSTSTLPESCLCLPTLTQEAIDTCDIAFDFSSAEGILSRILQLAEAKRPMIIGTTGWEKQEQEAKRVIFQHQASLLYSPNFSLGVQLFMRLANQAAEFFRPFPQYDLAIREVHHKQKLDAPSGTAKLLASAVKQDQANVSVLRSGYHIGTHELIFDSLEDSITLSHVARNREGFIRGAMQAAFWLIDKQGWFTLDDMVDELIYSTKRK